METLLWGQGKCKIIIGRDYRQRNEVVAGFREDMIGVLSDSVLGR